MQVSNKLVSSSNLVGKTERSHCKANKIRFSPSVFIIYLFIYFWLCWVSVAARAESKEELTSLLVKVKKKSEKAGLKFNIQ